MSLPLSTSLSSSTDDRPISNEQKELMDAVFGLLGDEAGDELPAGVQTAADSTPWVLCVDDDLDFSDALKCRLEQYGVAVVRAHDGTEGYRMAFSHPCSAILLDYQMPNGQGDYVLRRLKDSVVTSDIPVIMITGVRDSSVERKIRAMGAAAYFEKPVRFEALRDELANYIEILSTPVDAPLLT